MELRHLRYFIAVAETENITWAAEKLNVSQPPLSRQIRDLEDELGVRLFERSAKAVRLTDAGRVFYGEVRAVLDRADDAVKAVRAFAGGRDAEIHVGYAPSLTVEILPKTMRKLQETLPGLKVVLHDLSSGEMLERLRQREISMALSVEPAPEKSKGFQFVGLRRYAVCVAMAPTHPLGAVGEIPMERIAAERLVAYSDVDYPEYHEWLSGLFARMRRRPQISEQYDSVTSLIAAVEVGRGVALVPESLACLTGPRLVFAKLKPAPAPLRVGVLHRRGKLLASEAAFLAAARSVCR